MDTATVNDMEHFLNLSIAELRELVNEGAPQNQQGLPDYYLSFAGVFKRIKEVAETQEGRFRGYANDYGGMEGGRRKTRRKSRARYRK
jgi:hypothetical protein